MVGAGPGSSPGGDRVGQHLPGAGPAKLMDALKPSTSGGGDFVYLFERARRALTSRLQLEPVIADALALPGSANQAGMRRSDPGAELAQDTLGTAPARLIVELAVGEATRRPVVRVVDVQTGTTVRELPPASLAAVAAKLGRVITTGTR